MDFSFQIDGLDRIGKASAAVQQEIVKELNKGLYASAKKVESDAKRSILEGGKSGRIYIRRGVTHRASAPGEAPASDTGRLANSINSYLNATGLSAFITAGRGLAKYARMLEFGTSRILPRPFMLPAFQKNREWIAERLNKAVRTAVINFGKRK